MKLKITIYYAHINTNANALLIRIVYALGFNVPPVIYSNTFNVIIDCESESPR